MADITRVSLPEEFFDITSDLLLVQPEPQYLYAAMWKAALGVNLTAPSSAGMPDRSVSGAGAPYSSAERDRLVISPPLMAGMVTGKTDFKGLPGNMIRFNRPQFANTTYTEASRHIPGNTSISTSTINIGSEQVSLMLKRFGGPYDSVNNRVAPFGIDAFDARMGVHDLVSGAGMHMKRDFDRFIESVEVALLDLASVVVRPTNMTTDDTATAAGQFPLDYETVSRAEKLADEANLPTFPDGFRVLVLHPQQLHELKGDDDYQKYSSFHPQYNALYPGYVASIGKLHILKSNTLSSVNNSSSVPVRRGHLISPGVLLGGMGRPPRVAYSTDDNYGESAKIIWLADLAFGLADNRFVLSVRTA